MRHDFIDRYSRLNSRIHNLPASLKAGIAVGLVFITVIIPIYTVIYFSSLLIFLIVIAALSLIPAKFIIRRMLFLEPFILSVSILTLFQTNGIISFLNVVIRSTLCLFTMLLLSNTTPFDELIQLLRRLKIPALFLTVLSLMYRYIFVMIDEVERMQRARTSRTFTGNKSHIWKTRTVLISQLFIRSTERAERIYSAMRGRGWR